MNQNEAVIRWKAQKYFGDTIYLRPVDENDAQFIVDMRNQERSRYYLNQEDQSTVEGQLKWYNSYVSRTDDIYWIYCNRETNQKLGTIRLYNMEGKTCEIGSSTADLSVKDSFFSFIEAHSLAMKFALEELRMEKVHAITRVDNKFVDVVLKRLGFVNQKEMIVRGAHYFYYEFDTPKQEG